MTNVYEERARWKKVAETYAAILASSIASDRVTAVACLDMPNTFWEEASQLAGVKPISDETAALLKATLAKALGAYVEPEIQVNTFSSDEETSG